MTHWESRNKGATNETGFTALPSGSRAFNGVFYNIGRHGDWWSSTEYSSTVAFQVLCTNDRVWFKDYSYGKSRGLSVRCLQD
jgi:uncharacterized protein (TIGR02145 family)